MVKEEFLVVGKQKINSPKGSFNLVHLVTKFSAREAASASGRKSVTAMVTDDEFATIKIGKYLGFIVQNGKYTNCSFDELLEESPT